METKTVGYALHSFPYGETDKLVLFFTLAAGKVRLRVKGARRPQSRLAAVLELFAESELCWTSGRGGAPLLTGARLARSPCTARGNFASLARLQLLADFLRQGVPEGEPSEALYALLQRTLDRLEDAAPLQGPADRKTPSWPAGEAVLASFLLEFLRLQGHPLETARCASCGAKRPSPPLRLSVRHGGLLCGPCAGTRAAGLEIPPSARRLLAEPEAWKKGEAAPSDVRALLSALGTYFERLHERAVPALAYYFRTVPDPGT